MKDDSIDAKTEQYDESTLRIFFARLAARLPRENHRGVLEETEERKVNGADV